jgi:hypothetical protein
MGRRSACVSFAGRISSRAGLVGTIVVCLMGAAAARAETAWVLTTADFQRQGVDLVSLDGGGAVVRSEKGEQRTVPLEDFLQLERTAGAHDVPGKFTLYLASGDRISGEPVGVKDEQLQWKSAGVGELTIPIRQIAAFAKAAGQTLANLDETRLEDTVRLANGDTVKGIVTGMDASSVSVQVGGDESKVPMETVTSIYFASSGKVALPAGTAFRVRIADGSTVVAPKVNWSAGQVTLTLADGSTRKMDASKVAALEQMNGPVSWLSSRDPIENIQTPFLGEPWPARMDKSVRGDPIRFGDRLFTRGIGVHSYSRLTYALDGGWQAFRTSYAIDGDEPYADVTVRIKLDGKVVHEQIGFKAGVLSPVVSVDLQGAKALTLEVDYGASDDTQDRFNWIEPALLKKKPAPAPTPSPAAATAPTVVP